MMESGYIIKGKYMGENWKSRIYYNAEELDQDYYDYTMSEAFSEIKKYIVHLDYELFE